MSEKKQKKYSMKIKQFKDMNMWAAPMGTPQTPAPVKKSPGLNPMDMNYAGNTGRDGAEPHTNTQ